VLDLATSQSFTYHNNFDRILWLQIARGTVNINNHLLGQGDGISVSKQLELDLKAKEKCEILIFDMAGANSLFN
jgi:redox-sensitive bicupin YhaK (pirin superfamily)